MKACTKDMAVQPRYNWYIIAYTVYYAGLGDPQTVKVRTWIENCSLIGINSIRDISI